MKANLRHIYNYNLLPCRGLVVNHYERGERVDFERSKLLRSVACEATASDGTTVDLVQQEDGKLRQIDKVVGVTLDFDLSGKEEVKYLVKWKGDEDEEVHTWEPQDNVSPDVLRDYSQSWWEACKMRGGPEKLIEMLKGGPLLLANVLDENLRSPLHFAAAFGRADVVRALLKAGSNPNQRDSAGYTALHMAAGYMHSACVTALLEGGADPNIQDNNGQTIPMLLDDLRGKIDPEQPGMLPRRMTLEDAAAAVDGFNYEEVAVRRVLDQRPGPDPENPTKEYLVQWADGSDDSWVPEEWVGEVALAAYEAGDDLGVVQDIIDCRQLEDLSREYKVTWEGSSETTWVAEELLSPTLVVAWQALHSREVQAMLQLAKDGSPTTQGLADLVLVDVPGQGEAQDPNSGVAKMDDEEQKKATKAEIEKVGV